MAPISLQDGSRAAGGGGSPAATSLPHQKPPLRPPPGSQSQRSQRTLSAVIVEASVATAAVAAAAASSSPPASVPVVDSPSPSSAAPSGGLAAADQPRGPAAAGRPEHRLFGVVLRPTGSPALRHLADGPAAVPSPTSALPTAAASTPTASGRSPGREHVPGTMNRRPTAPPIASAARAATMSHARSPSEPRPANAAARLPRTGRPPPPPPPPPPPLSRSLSRSLSHLPKDAASQAAAISSAPRASASSDTLARPPTTAPQGPASPAPLLSSASTGRLVSATRAATVGAGRDAGPARSAASLAAVAMAARRKGPAPPPPRPGAATAASPLTSVSSPALNAGTARRRGPAPPPPALSGAKAAAAVAHEPPPWRRTPSSSALSAPSAPALPPMARAVALTPLEEQLDGMLMADPTMQALYDALFDATLASPPAGAGAARPPGRASADAGTGIAVSGSAPRPDAAEAVLPPAAVRDLWRRSGLDARTLGRVWALVAPPFPAALAAAGLAHAPLAVSGTPAVARLGLRAVSATRPAAAAAAAAVATDPAAAAAIAGYGLSRGAFARGMALIDRRLSGAQACPELVDGRRFRACLADKQRALASASPSPSPSPSPYKTTKGAPSMPAVAPSSTPPSPPAVSMGMAIPIPAWVPTIATLGAGPPLHRMSHQPSLRRGHSASVLPAVGSAALTEPSLLD
ncbi:hypothetical protein CXG81DRAFT_24268 [Caulochytrium protostelioides]|uniref:Uncharacterized protein n=1 Tax=Caulochytrium protostelioides TaxID=1555241 RepID=A0A4P9XD29_9FUNG|nr:hypothetical protein CXG81DRAFT_24268 [Caulochytrium protostelioides]|eukprot:RKP03061.1 hypothetical protein CXG81DRAFT_24268 [Caulochytrium protostelioides]